MAPYFSLETVTRPENKTYNLVVVNDIRVRDEENPDSWILESGWLCDDYFSEMEARSICLSMGKKFKSYRAQIQTDKLEGATDRSDILEDYDFVMDDFYCSFATDDPFVWCDYDSTHNCEEWEGVHVECEDLGPGESLWDFPTPTPTVPGSLGFGLTNGNRGLLYTSGGWVCDDWFGETEAEVVCYVLRGGLEFYATQQPTAGYPEFFQESDYGIDDFHCYTRPEGLQDCTWSRVDNCFPSEGVFLDCSNEFVDLSGSSKDASTVGLIAGLVCGLVMLFCLYTACVILERRNRKGSPANGELQVVNGRIVGIPDDEEGLGMGDADSDPEVDPDGLILGEKEGICVLSSSGGPTAGDATNLPSQPSLPPPKPGELPQTQGALLGTPSFTEASYVVPLDGMAVPGFSLHDETPLPSDEEAEDPRGGRRPSLEEISDPRPPLPRKNRQSEPDPNLGASPAPASGPPPRVSGPPPRVKIPSLHGQPRTTPPPSQAHLLLPPNVRSPPPPGGGEVGELSRSRQGEGSAPPTPTSQLDEDEPSYVELSKERLGPGASTPAAGLDRNLRLAPQAIVPPPPYLIPGHPEFHADEHSRSAGIGGGRDDNSALRGRRFPERGESVDESWDPPAPSTSSARTSARTPPPAQQLSRGDPPLSVSPSDENKHNEDESKFSRLNTLDVLHDESKFSRLNTLDVLHDESKFSRLNTLDVLQEARPVARGPQERRSSSTFRHGLHLPRNSPSVPLEEEATTPPCRSPVSLIRISKVASGAKPAERWSLNDLASPPPALSVESLDPDGALTELSGQLDPY